MTCRFFWSLNVCVYYGMFGVRLTSWLWEDERYHRNREETHTHTHTHTSDDKGGCGSNTAVNATGWHTHAQTHWHKRVHIHSYICESIKRNPHFNKLVLCSCCTNLQNTMSHSGGNPKLTKDIYLIFQSEFIQQIQTEMKWCHQPDPSYLWRAVFSPQRVLHHFLLRLSVVQGIISAGESWGLCQTSHHKLVSGNRLTVSHRGCNAPMDI